MLDRGDQVDTCEEQSSAWQIVTNGLEFSDAVRTEWECYGRSKGLLPMSMNDLRKFPRFHADSSAVLYCRHSLPAFPRPDQKYLVYVINLSREGLGFLHEEMLFPSETMAIALPSGVRIDICVMRCVRRESGCYEIGARFVAVRRS